MVRLYRTLRKVIELKYYYHLINYKKFKHLLQNLKDSFLLKHIAHICNIQFELYLLIFVLIIQLDFLTFFTRFL